MAPFLPGDFITFAGIRRGSEVIAYSIIAMNVQITTLGELVYVRMELGLLGISNFNPNTELAESRVCTSYPEVSQFLTWLSLWVMPRTHAQP